MSDTFPPAGSKSGGSSGSLPWTQPKTDPGAPPAAESNFGRDAFRELEAVLGRRMDSMATENETLRKQLRWTTTAIVLLFVAIVVLGYLAAPRAAGVAESLQANQFVLRDGSGLVRGLWELEEGAGPRMVLRDSDGRERVRLSLLADGSPGVTLGDREGRPRVVLGLLPDGTTNLVFADGAGNTRALLGHSSADATTLLLADRDGFTRAGLVVDSNGEGALTLYEEDTRAGMVPAAEVVGQSDGEGLVE